MKKNNPTTLVVVCSIMFFMSGVTSLALQVVLNKYFSFIFGVSAYAIATVLAAFMLGLAIGSYVIGRRSVSSFKKLFLTYGLLEFFIGVYAIFFVSIADGIQSFFIGFVHSAHLGFGFLTMLRFLSAIVLIGVPTFLMGGTLPMLIEAIRQRGVKEKMNLIYGFNVAGAALGVVITAYVLMPALQIDGTLRFIFTVNSIVLLLSIFLERVYQRRTNDFEEAKSILGGMQTGDHGISRKLLFVAFFSGFLTFGNEVYWNHLLSLIVGTSVYAYSIMLFTTLLGMTSGSFLAYRVARSNVKLDQAIAGSLVALGIIMLVTIPLWDKVPLLFLKLGGYIQSFEMRELVRFVASFVVIFPAAFAAGLVLPLVFSQIEKSSHMVGDQLGRVYAINTIGSILGSLTAGFLLLEWYGGRQAIMANAVASIVVGVGVLFVLRRAWVFLAGSVATVTGVLILSLPPWDQQIMLSGANIYFEKAHDDFEELLWQREDHIGGVTSIVRNDSTLTMLTNGKFQGNNGREIVDQSRFAIIPNMFVTNTQHALNIGLGTGMTLGVIGEFPYKTIDVVELSPHIIETANRYFSDINFGILRDPRTSVHVQDGRNYLTMLPLERKFDLISIELTSIWFAGAGNLYNDEFYALAKEHMNEGAVIQQWLQLHHISIRDIGIILKTLRNNFRYVQLWLPGHQGIIIASDEPLQVRPDRIADLKDSRVAHTLLFNEVDTLWGEVLLNEREVDHFLADLEAKQPLLLSTDNNLFLEYSTPKGNSLGWNFDENFAELRRYSAYDNFQTMLPQNMLREPTTLGKITLGKSVFYEKHSLGWHEIINQGLSQIEDETHRHAIITRILDSGAKSATQKF